MGFMVQVNKVSRNGVDAVLFTDVKQMTKELNNVDPNLNKAMKADYRRIAQPAQAAVKAGIPNRPLTSGIHRQRQHSSVSGFYPVVVPGRLTWGTGKPAKSVLIETKMPKARKKGFNSIVRLRVGSAATVVSDMAGTAGTKTRRPVTREYDYSQGGRMIRRTHRVTTQGRSMVSALNKARNGKGQSRFIYPAFEKVAPKVRAEAMDVIDTAVEIINKRIRTP